MRQVEVMVIITGDKLYFVILIKSFKKHNFMQLKYTFTFYLKWINEPGMLQITIFQMKTVIDTKNMFHLISCDSFTTEE